MAFEEPPGARREVLVGAHALDLSAKSLGVGLFGPRLRRSLPVSLIGVAAATLVAELAGLDLARIGALPSSLPTPSLPSLTPTRISELFGPGPRQPRLPLFERGGR